MKMMTSEDAGLTARALLVVLLAAAIIVGLAFTNAAGASERSRGTLYLPHPPGCPAARFCGCGASVDVCKRNIRSLWPSTAWFRFPRTAPAPNTVAVRRGHVFVLKQHVRGSVWMVNDYNSGGRRSRYHARSIAGYVIVQPSCGAQYAGAR